jgi:DNA repair ATPase RecN
MELDMTKQPDFLKPLLDLMNHNAEELSKRMDTQDKKLDTITSVANQALTQAKYTNGRVTKQEKRLADIKNQKIARKFNVDPKTVYIFALCALVVLVIVATLLHINLAGTGI